jgi:transposase-like protein
MSSEQIVPEDFDLNDALNAYSTTPREEMSRCPNCESVNIQRKSTRPRSARQTRTEDWRCFHCEEHFEEPLPPRVQTEGEA